jgi:hypothetical protein
MLTGRQCLRRPDIVQEERVVGLLALPRFDPDLPNLTLQEPLALVALARATREREPLARVHAGSAGAAGSPRSHKRRKPKGSDAVE